MTTPKERAEDARARAAESQQDFRDATSDGEKSGAAGDPDGVQRARAAERRAIEKFDTAVVDHRKAMDDLKKATGAG